MLIAPARPTAIIHFRKVSLENEKPF